MKFRSKHIYYEYIDYLLRIGYITEETALELVPLINSDKMELVDHMLGDIEGGFHGRQKDYLRSTFYKDLENGELSNHGGEGGQSYLYDLLLRQHSTENLSLNQTVETLKTKLGQRDVELQQSVDRELLMEKAAARFKTMQAENERLSQENMALKKENKELKEFSQQKRIDGKIPGYVKEVSAKLDLDDKGFSQLATRWSIIGFVAAFLAVIAAFFTFAEGSVLLANAQVYDEIALLYVFFRGVLGVGLLSWLANVCFSTSRNYTHESIRRKDRQHALNFGRLFLQIYGASAEKEEMLNVFKDWNMAGDSSFSKDAAAPPSVLEMLESLNKLKTGLLSKGKSVVPPTGGDTPPR